MLLFKTHENGKMKEGYVAKHNLKSIEDKIEYGTTEETHSMTE